MFQIQQMVEIRSDQQGFDNSDNLNRKEALSASMTRRSFIRNTAGSFDLNVNNLNLNESQSNLKIIIEAQQNDFHSFPFHDTNNISQSQQRQQQQQQQQQHQIVRSPIDSVFSGSASALASYFATPADNLSKSSNENRRYTSCATTSEYLSRNEQDEITNCNETNSKKNRSESATPYTVFTTEHGYERELSSTGSYSDSNANFDDNTKIKAGLPFNNDIPLNNSTNFDALDSIDLTTEDSSYASNKKEANNSSSFDIINKNVKIKKQKKTSAFAWVGRTVGK